MIKPLGDKGIIIYFDNEISEHVLERVHSLKIHIENENIEAIREIVTSYNALAVYYDVMQLTYSEIKNRIELLIEKPTIKHSMEEEIMVPVYYNGSDIEQVSEYTKLSREEIIKLHTDANYTVYMIGFSPGFPYLGGMNKKIATPRRKTPRLKIEAGSVGIAGEQTGIYSVDSPGGWQIIGETPIKLFDISSSEPVLLKSNMRLKFYEISEKEYLEWEC